MAAVDYARLRDDLPRSRLLFVAHRNEILDQSLATFRDALRDASFGEKWIGGSRPHASTCLRLDPESHCRQLDDLAPDHFDVVIVDEFHHAAAPRTASSSTTWTPRSCSASPPRPTQRRPVDPALVRRPHRRRAPLWDALDQQRLSPFMYFGIHDGLDLTDIRGARPGLRREALSNLYTSTDAWARTVLQEVLRLADVPATMRALGFCVSIEHAHSWRSTSIRPTSLPSRCGVTARRRRKAALEDLAAGKIRVVFSVDLFNEGVDVPAVDTVLMLRPTESPTLFLQQLGRGLRRSKGKTFCTVLDFVGTHRREFRFDRRYRALIGGTRRDIERAVQQGFPFLPAGCYMQLDEKASEIVLRSLREAIPTRWPARVEELRVVHASHPMSRCRSTSRSPDLTCPTVRRLTWLVGSCEAAGVPIAPAGEHEKPLRKALGRLLHIDDDERIATYRRLLESHPVDVSAMSERERRLVACSSPIWETKCSPRTSRCRTPSISLVTPAGTRRARPAPDRAR